MHQVSRKKMLARWQNAEYDKSVRAFRNVFHKDYEGTVETMEAELNLMDADVKKATDWELWRLYKELGEMGVE